MRKLLALFFLSATTLFAQAPYTTNFPLTENPISEGGKWTSCGAATGGLWGDVKTAAGTGGIHQATGTVISGAPPYNDSTAVLAGTFTSNQTVSAVVHTVNQTGSFQEEVELHLNRTCGGSSNAGYEFDFSVQPASGQLYIVIVRWNGPLNNFCYLHADKSCTNGSNIGGISTVHINNGDTLMATSSLSAGVVTLTVFVNGVQEYQALDNGSGSTTCSGACIAGPFTSGAPGVGFWNSGGTLAAFNDYGFSSFTGGNTPSAANACPTGATVPSTNVATPSAFTTLANIGVTTCYYIAANGSNSNTGADELHPWQFGPGMQNCSGNCAASKIQPGVGFIYRGGDTWHFGNSALSPYAGIKTGCTGNGNTSCGFAITHDIGGSNGTSANPIYYGVDQNWYAGASWVRPIFNADNPICNRSTLSASCTSYTNLDPAPPNGDGLSDGSNLTVYVPSCSYQMGNANVFVMADNTQNRIMHNVELVGLCKDASPVSSQKKNEYFSFSAITDLWFFSDYVHGWTHTQYSIAPPNGGCQNTTSNVCYGAIGFAGSGTAPHGDHYRYVVVDGQDSDPMGLGAGDQIGNYDLAYSIFRYQSQWLGNSHMHLAHDNILEWNFENGHSNLGELGEDPSIPVSAWYNNIWRNNYTFQPGAAGAGARQGVGVWTAHGVASSPGSYKVYFFNNLMYTMTGEGWDNSADQGANSPALFAFNNTLEKPGASTAILSCSTGNPGVSPVTLVNNHWIDDSSPYAPNCTSQFTANPLNDKVQTHAQANANNSPHFDQYTVSQAFANSPVASTNSTVGAGTPVSYCSALTTAAASDPSLTDAAARCSQGTTYACNYITTNHTMSCPALTLVPRPNPPDVGAYQLMSTVTISPSAENFGTVTIGLSSTTQVATLTNNTTSPITVSSVSTTGPNFTDFPTTASNCSGTVAANGGSCTVTKKFSPSFVGGESATLTVATSAGSFNVALSGIGVSAAQPGVSFSPTNINFGSVATGQTSSPQTITITSTGTANLTFGPTGTSSPAGASFSPVGGGTCPISGTLTPGSNCTQNIQATITSGLGVLNGTFNFPSNVTGSPQSVPLSVTGVNVVASFSPTSLGFGSLPLYTASAPMQATLTNSGTANMTISSVTTSGILALVAPTLAPDCRTVGTLAPTASCNFAVTVTPAVAGLASGSVVFTDNAVGSPQSYPVTVTGLAVPPAPTPSFAMAANLTGCKPAFPPAPTWCFTGDGHIYFSSCGPVTCGAFKALSLVVVGTAQ